MKEGTNILKLEFAQSSFKDTVVTDAFAIAIK